MIQKGTKLVVADNTGAKEAICIGILGSGSSIAKIGDRIIVSVRKVLPNCDIKSGTISKAVVVRTVKELRRSSGDYIRFSDNAVVLINENKDMKGTRIFGPVTKELALKGYNKIVSLAKEVL